MSKIMSSIIEQEEKDNALYSEVSQILKGKLKKPLTEEHQHAVERVNDRIIQELH